MIRTQVYLPKALYHQINWVAKRERKAKAAIIQEAIEKGLKKETSKETIGEALLKLAKLGEELNVKGPKDLSVAHDKYLYEE